MLNVVPMITGIVRGVCVCVSLSVCVCSTGLFRGRDHQLPIKSPW